MTFVLGLTGERIAARYLPKTALHARPDGDGPGAARSSTGTTAPAATCSRCPSTRSPTGTKVAEAFTDFKTNVRASYNNRANDYLAELYPGADLRPQEEAGRRRDRGAAGAHPRRRHRRSRSRGCRSASFENELTVQLWRPVTIRGYHVQRRRQPDARPDQDPEGAAASGGDFAWLYATTQAERTGRPFAPFWNRLPPPLLREGKKVQTPWLTAFLKDPYPIRPAVQLRMPRFHYGKSEQAASQRDRRAGELLRRARRRRVPLPGDPRARRPATWRERVKAHPDYLGAGWQMMTQGSPCLQCHAIGQYKPTGGGRRSSTDRTSARSRRGSGRVPGEWLANPRRLVPYTAMPQNIVPHGADPDARPQDVREPAAGDGRAIRDTLLNYVNAVELQLASSNRNGGAAPAGADGPKTSSTSP